MDWKFEPFGASARAGGCMRHSMRWPVERCLAAWNNRPASIAGTGAILVIPVVGDNIRRLDWRRADGTNLEQSPADTAGVSWTIDLARRAIELVQKCKPDALLMGGQLVFHQSGLWWRTGPTGAWFIAADDASAHELLKVAEIVASIEAIPL